MSLRHVLLGLLSFKADAGYSLHKRIFRPGRPTLSQIYRALNEMMAEGYVNSKRVEQTKLPARNVFELTEAGQSELTNWLRGPWPEEPIRSSCMQRLWFGSKVDQAAIIRNIELYRDNKTKEREYYRGYARRLADKNLKMFGGQLDKAYWDLVFDYVDRRSKAEIEWAEAALRCLAVSDTDTPIDVVEQPDRGKCQSGEAVQEPQTSRA